MVKDLLLTIRYKNLIILSLLFACFEFFIYNKEVLIHFNNSSLYFYAIVVITAAGGYVINDLFDKKGDQLNNKRIFNSYSEVTLLLIYISLTLLSVILAIAFTNKAMQQVTILAILFLLLYSWKLQHWPIIGNVTIALLASFVPIMVFIAHPEFSPIIENPNTPIEDLVHYLFILLYAFFAFLTTLARELVKDMEDIEGDRSIKSKTLAVTAGIRFTKALTFILLILICFLLLLLLKDRKEMQFSSFTSISIIALLLFPLFLSGWKLIKAHNKRQFNLVSTILKITIAGSLFVIIIHSYT